MSDEDTAAAVVQIAVAGGMAYDAGGKPCGGGNGTCHMQILDGCLVDIAERCGKFLIGIIVKGQRVAVAVEDA